MLTLILTHGDSLRAVQKDVRGHQNRIREQADTGVVAALLGGLVLELRHTAGFTETGDAVQDPRQLCVLGNLTLHEQRRPIRIDPHRKELSDRNLGATTQFLRSCVTVMA